MEASSESEYGSDYEHEYEWEVDNIFLAAENGFDEQVLRFIRQGQDINAIEHPDPGFTPLFYAISEGHYSTVELLLKYGADPYIKDSLGYTALDQAYEQNDDHMVELILKHMKLQKARQDLALVSFFNPRLGNDSPLKYLDYDVMTDMISKPRRYEPDIHIRMMDERRRDLSRIRPIPSVPERLMLEDRQPIVQQTQLEPEVLDIIEMFKEHPDVLEEIFKEHPEFRTDQYGSGLSNRRKRTRKRLYRQY